ncbi:prepilin-type N-terminal cleavage/methylation domain-containing protein [Chitinilyticum piscinae]|uniref:Prepilin-type N-terminal cleavage/methylation domain-containing protein n=1 Tax=Chitinilyticum piscinae TaxID=2866724 RepID=A0A8J7FUF2_9NEIS|nr:prepilin-type N-terminal cleavage/methylation domain-containing protein [Chitinilyticum piscinae]MBE9610791.1 prepilin-type N-terminal cleavage/methylation domain-containing protein [Chitinilyticum piscinae]
MRPLRSQHGISLIEVMIAVAILAVGLLVLSRFTGTLYRDVAFSADRSRAQNMAQQKIDELRATGASTTTSGSDGAADCSTGSFRRYWTVSTPGTPPGVKSISMNVCWTDSRGNAQTLAVSTYIATSSSTTTPAPSSTPTATPAATPTPSYPAWQANTAYPQGTVVSYNGSNYRADYAIPASYTSPDAWNWWSKI